MPPVDPLSPNTLGALIDEGSKIFAHCYEIGCQHSSQLDLEALVARLGREHGCMHWDLVPKLRCSKCDGKDVGIRRLPLTGSPGKP